MTDTEFDVEIDPTEESGLPQTIQLNPDAIINQLMRRYSGQLQQQTWENTLLATENEQLKTMLTEAKAQTAEDEAAIAELVSQLGALTQANRELAAAALTEIGKSDPLGTNARMTEQLSPVGDPQQVDGFLAMAAGQ